MTIAAHILENVQRQVAAQPSLVDDPPQLVALIREEARGDQ